MARAENSTGDLYPGSAANVALAIRELRPFAVDVSSGIESNGAKDFARMREFISKVRC